MRIVFLPETEVNWKKISVFAVNAQGRLRQQTELAIQSQV